MGIVRRQSLKSSIYIYIGFAIGAFNVLYLFPKYLGDDAFGLTRVLQDAAMLIAMFCTVGSCPAVLKFYPFYKSYLPDKKNDLPLITVSACILGCILFLSLTPIFKGFILRKFGERSPLFVDYFYLIYPLTVCYALWYLFEASSWSIQKTVLPNFLKEVGFRLITTIFALLFIFRIITFNVFANLFSWIYILPVAILCWSLVKNNYLHLNFQLSSVTKRLWKQIVIFSLFVFSGQFLNILARTADTIILASQSKNGLADVAVFNVAIYLVTLMDVPMRGMTGIASSVIAYAWKDKDLNKIKEMYQKTALSLVIVGLGIMGILVLNMHNATNYFGKTYNSLPTLLLVLGFAKLVDLGTGMNAQILLSSKYWKIDFITSMCFVLLSIPLNVFLIRRYGLEGSAYGTLISVFVYNATRFIVIKKLFNIQPYKIANVYAIIIALGCFILVYIIPQQSNIYLDTFIRTVTFSILYISLILYLKISIDFNDLYLLTLQKIKAITVKSKP